MRRPRFRIRTLMLLVAVAALVCLCEAERRYVARWQASLAVREGLLLP